MFADLLPLLKHQLAQPNPTTHPTNPPPQPNPATHPAPPHHPDTPLNNKHHQENFEIAASPIPHLFLPTFRRSRAALLRMLRASLAAGDFKGAPVEELIEGCGLRASLHPNVLLAVLWASQANSVAAMFWALGFLLLPENARCLAAVRAEINQAAAEEAAAGDANNSSGSSSPWAKGSGGSRTTTTPTTRSRAKAAASEANQAAVHAAIVRLALDRRSVAARCVSETIRLRVHSIAIRLVAPGQRELVLQIPAAPAPAPAAAGLDDREDSSSRRRRRNSSSSSKAAEPPPPPSPSPAAAAAAPTRELRVPRGTMLAVCPFVSHHDGALFGGDGSAPWAYDPDRSPVQMEPGTVATSTAGFGFGGGFWRCPGRFFAELELALLLMAAARYLDLSIAAGGKGGGGGGRDAAAGGDAAAAGEAGGGVLAAAGRIASALLPKAVAEFGGVAAVAADGAFDRETARWEHSGDPGRLLPPVELRRLVGFKVPATGLLVDVDGRR